MLHSAYIEREGERRQERLPLSTPGASSCYNSAIRTFRTDERTCTLAAYFLIDTSEKTRGATIMSGHSKWAQIRRSKGVNDARRGQLFTRLGREIVVAVREGGSADPNANFRLRMAVQRARDANMPLDNIERTIKRASGGTEGSNYEEITYEGYGPGGAAILVQALTDNRNRTVSEVRNAFNRNGGNMGENGCVDWLFESKGIIEVELKGHDPDELSIEAIDLGADDVEPANPDDEVLVIYTDPSDLEKVRRALEDKKYKVLKSESTMVPKTKIELSDEKAAHQTIRLIEKLEDLDDVQNVYTNADFPEAFAASYQG
jgi:YebC/PmpR family DNA-binding regulatory protein